MISYRFNNLLYTKKNQQTDTHNY